MKESDISLEIELIKLVTRHYNFEEKFSETVEYSDEFTTIKKVIENGVFINDSRQFAIWCNSVSNKVFNLIIEKKFNELRSVEKFYRGEKYFLVTSQEDIYGFDIEYYEQYENMFTELYYQYESSDKEEFYIGSIEKGKVLLIKTDFALFGIAGINMENMVEEERLILSQRLDESEPFFKYKPLIHFDWNILKSPKDETFEKLTEELLFHEKKTKKVTPIGKTRASDRGRDFEVIEAEDSFDREKITKWLVQCKFSKNSISPDTISGWTDRVIEHGYDGFWLITNNDITPSLFDQFKDVEKNNKYSIKTKFWQRNDMNIKLNLFTKHIDKSKYFEQD